MIYKTLYRKLKIEQHEHHQKPDVSSGAPEWLVLPAILVIIYNVCFVSCDVMMNVLIIYNNRLLVCSIIFSMTFAIHTV